jgi:hypothetical protein
LRDKEKTMRGEQKRLDGWEMRRRCTGDDSENSPENASPYVCVTEKTTRGEQKKTLRL